MSWILKPIPTDKWALHERWLTAVDKSALHILLRLQEQERIIPEPYSRSLILVHAEAAQLGTKEAVVLGFPPELPYTLAIEQTDNIAEPTARFRVRFETSALDCVLGFPVGESTTRRNPMSCLRLATSPLPVHIRTRIGARRLCRKKNQIETKPFQA